ncbi:MAG: hypothetical protein ABIR05_06240 [Luteimonas sp.]
MLKIMKPARIASGLVLALAVGLASGAAFSQAASGLVLDNAVFQEVQVKGPDGKVSIKRVPVTTVVPGNEVIYEIRYDNAGKAPATDVAINNPVPTALAFVATEGAPVTAVSVDGGKNFGKLADLTVAGNDGKPRAAQNEDVTNLRWVVARIDPGSKGKVSFRARVK